MLKIGSFGFEIPETQLLNIIMKLMFICGESLDEHILSLFFYQIQFEDKLYERFPKYKISIMMLNDINNSRYLSMTFYF